MSERLFCTSVHRNPVLQEQKRLFRTSVHRNPVLQEQKRLFRTSVTPKFSPSGAAEAGLVPAASSEKVVSER
ncbi:MAG: hypothetical protein MJY84_03685 [Bacteroidales bacterium]|nr:hypothetical protein [Bacteroidales bacterium]